MATPRACPSLSALRALFGVKEIFDGDTVGPALREERGQPGVDVQQLFRKRRQRSGR